MFENEELRERIVNGLRTGKARPFMLELRPTNRCNLSCASCVTRGTAHFPAESELTGDDYLKIIDDAATLGIRHVQISGGGEPFIRGNELLEMMKRIKSHSLSGWIVSNGTLFNDEMLESLVKMRWDTLFLSLDAPDAELNDFLRGKGTFDRIVSSIRKLNALKQKHGCNEPQIHVGPVLSHYNCSTLSDMVTLCADLGVGMVLFQPVMVPHTDEGRKFMLTDDDKQILAKQIGEAKRIAQERGVETNLDEIDSQMLDKSTELPEVISDYSKKNTHPWLSIPCFSPWYYVGINPDGTLGPCSIDSDTTYVQNVREHSLNDAWTGEIFESFRKALSAGELPELCERCCGSNVMITNRVRESLRKVVDE